MGMGGSHGNNYVKPPPRPRYDDLRHLAEVSPNSTTAYAPIYDYKASPDLPNVRLAYLQAAAACLITTKQAAINDLFNLIPSTNGPWTLVTNLGANTMSVNDCPDVGPVLQHYVQLLTTTLVPFTNKSPGSTLVAADSLGCSFGAVYQAPSTKPATWFDSHAFATPQGALPNGAECPYGVWLVKAEDGTIVEPTGATGTLSVVRDPTVEMYGIYNVVRVVA
ncbi:hypothetical protein SPRG_14491 [Saprolegnia parasitica CBS 223.65]|uniref:Uncharacterized protein n=1 Tax=Saprolegnia parasitica (strain CBS 223.65) TaxID=695850 RepID=A0A067BTU6_SAPPC|nr:hypothetical protein SPRG_14491 [Saprolegnia parasitica CBS 223.65]KDO20245.1 hypothetical protein SPRG_14491 [Saprolegnia parasitica CBS 223.65]|eukprot:XP_012209057.1 hypothetical protein SPRG_14491 [Saprolegnia parasitica CBS 223.65]